MERLHIDNFPLKIIHSARKTIAIEIKPDAILVRVPNGTSQREIDSVLQEKRSWIEKHLAKIQGHNAVLARVTPFTMEEIRRLADWALTVIPERVRFYAPIVDVTYGRITIRNQRSRWGSCSSKGNLNFNCLLMLFPEEVRDYVVVHELCHRKHMNRSAEFYKEIERVLPEYRKSQKWLKEYGGLYLRRLP